MSILHVQASPHERSNASVSRIMLCVLLALIPTVVNGCLNYGLNAVILLAATTFSAVAFEFLCRVILRRPQSAQDLSAAVTGLMLGLTLPISTDFPFWYGIIGSFAAVVVVKQLFGGIGRNLLNPAAAGHLVLYLAFHAAFVVKYAADSVSYSDLLFGHLPDSIGSIGAESAAGVILGDVFLWLCGIISAAAPAAWIGSFALCSWLAGNDVLYQLLSGGVLFAAVFMANDYITTPLTKRGKFLFGLGCGCISFALRQFTDLHGDVIFAVLIMNLLTPLIDRLICVRPFGAGYAEKEKSAQKT